MGPSGAWRPFCFARGRLPEAPLKQRGREPLGTIGVDPEIPGLTPLLRRLGMVVFRRAVDATLRFERAEGRCAELLGISSSTLTGDAYSFWSHVLAEDRARALGLLQDAVRKGGTYRVEYRLRAPSGSIHSVVEEGAAIVEPLGRETIALDGVITSAVTLRAGEAGSADYETQQRYEALVSQSEEMIAEISADAKIVLANPQLCAELGRSAVELQSLEPLQLVHAQDRMQVRAAAERMLLDREPCKVLCRLEKAEGGWIWGELSGSVFETETGEVRGIISGRNVGNRIRVEETFLAQRAAEARIGELSRRFLELGSEGLDRAIREGLDAAAAIASADRCYLIDFSDARVVSEPHSRRAKIYISGDDHSGFEEWSSNQGPRHEWMREILHRGDVVRIARLSDLGEEYAETRRTFESRGTRSFCAIPVRADGRMTAMLCLQNFRVEHDWTEQEVALLRLVAELFASALKRREFEGALRDGEQRIRALTDAAQDAICETEVMTGRILYANPRYFEMLGYDPETSGDMTCYSVIHPEDRAKVEGMEGAFARGELGDAAAGTLLYRARFADSERWLWLEANGRMFTTASGARRTSSVIRDVTERESAKQAMARSLEQEALIAGAARQLLALGVEDIDEGLREALASLAPISAADRSWLATVESADASSGQVWEWSRKGCERTLFGLEELTGGLPELRALLAEGRELRLPSDDRFGSASPERCLMEERGARALLVIPLLSGADLIGVLGFERLDRDEDWSDESIALLRLAGSTFASALSRKRAEEELRESRSQLLQAQKMEAVGTLAGGVAHDFNNQLSVILGNSRYVRGEMPEGTDLVEALVDLERAGEHCAQLTRSLLSFSRRTPSVRQPVPVSRIVTDARDLIRPLIPPTIDLSATAHDEADCVLADPTQLQQVLVNLLVNARDAMPNGGSLTLSTALRVLDEAAATRLQLDSPGAYVEFSLADTGIGMDAETMSRIFEPFFTTKVQGKGTGLGLATVYGLARDSGGTVTVESEEGQGTTFRLLLPRYLTEECVPVPEPEPTVAAEAAARVLVVDDEAPARRLMRRMLEGRGFEVLEAADGEQALEVAGKFGPGIDVLVTDVSMPRLGGLALAQRLRLERPGLAVLLVTGSNEDGSAVPGAQVLAKPFRSAELVGALVALLEDRPNS